MDGQKDRTVSGFQTPFIVRGLYRPTVPTDKLNRPDRTGIPQWTERRNNIFSPGTPVSFSRMGDEKPCEVPGRKAGKIGRKVPRDQWVLTLLWHRYRNPQLTAEVVITRVRLMTALLLLLLLRSLLLRVLASLLSHPV